MIQMKAPVTINRATERQKCIWLASYPKSGNTWVRAFLHNLLGVMGGGSEAPHSINLLQEHTAWELLPRDYDAYLGKPAQDASAIEIAKARYAIQEQIAGARPQPFLMKTHNAIASVAGSPTINLDVTLAVIYLVRNPLDVAISYSHHSSFPVDAIIRYMADEKLATTMTQLGVYEYLGSWSFHVASWLSVPNRPVHVIRYEDLLHDSERQFTGLARFLRLEASTGQICEANKRSAFEELARQEAQCGFIERPKKAEKFFRSGKAGQWREVLTREQITAIVSAHAPMMQRFGYLPPDCGADFRPTAKPLVS